MLEQLRRDLHGRVSQGDVELHQKVEDGSGLEEIHAFLALRILGIVPASRLTGHDLLLVLIKLAESQDPITTVDTFLTTTSAPHPHSGERSSYVPAPA
ncbi:hypothetical protein AB0D94_20725 [Streptomyces sp. NPDC048255]|uniref:hypothetical protein n=1 Tax=Streptomyces sp. NPDC048255 TaxID=3154713 RepID=UPI0033F97A60